MICRKKNNFLSDHYRHQTTDKVKILGTGELKAKLSFKINAISGKAKEVIEAAGGTIEIVK